MAATSSNRRQYATIVETTLGVTPTTPRMRAKLAVSDSLSYAPTFSDSNELRSDRMTSDVVLTGVDSGGAVPWEFHYPFPDGYFDIDIRSALYNAWVNTPVRDNDGVADSQITDIGTVANTLTCLAAAGTGVNSGTFVVGHLVRTSNFANAANNKVSVVTTGGSTSFVATGAGYVAEAVPPATARAKVVGFQGTSGDITATATGLAATTLNFLNMGLAVGQWLKVGGTATATRFATAALNTRVRIIAISATAITLDNLPTGWAVDAGTGKTISVWFGDRIINGTTQVSQTIERGDLGLAVPIYIAQPGMVMSQFAMTVRPKSIITGTSTYVGMGGGTVSTVSLDSVIDPPPPQSQFPQFAGSAHVGRVNEFGSALVSPNWCTGVDMTIANNLSPVESVDAVGPQDLVPGEATVSGTLMTIFGDQSILSRFFAGTPSQLSVPFQKGTQMVVLTIPRLIYNGGGNPNAGGKNQLIPVNFQFKSSKDDALTNCEVSLDRLEYFEV